MEPIYSKIFHIPSSAVDRYDRLRPSHILDYMQEVAGDHSAMLGTDRSVLMQKHLFWAVIRHRVQITRLPRSGEIITVKTWPMPTTRTAYPRATAVFDEKGNECFRAISLWVLMDTETRAMVLPGKSGVTVEGTCDGSELPAPGSLAPRSRANNTERTVLYTDLDVNGHMNNCRCLDWMADLLPSGFHCGHIPAEFSVCYLTEGREGDRLSLQWEIGEDGALCLDASREGTDMSTGHSRVFSLRMQY